MGSKETGPGAKGEDGTGADWPGPQRDKQTPGAKPEAGDLFMADSEQKWST